MDVSSVIQKCERIHWLYIVTFLCVVGFIIYGNTLQNQLFYDDEHFIYKNVFVKNFSLNDFFTHSITAGGGSNSNYYRPVLMVFFATEYALFKNDGFIYHLDSFLLHIFSSILLFTLLKKLFNQKLLAFLSSLLFLVHPVQTEAIAFASGKGDPLSLFFMLIALNLCLSDQTKQYILALCFFILGLLSKEIVIITPLFVFMLRVIVSGTLTKKTIIIGLKKSLPFFGIAFGYFLLRLTVLNFQNTLNFYNHQNIYTESVFVRINTFLNLIPEYFALLFFPQNLFIDRPSLVYPSLTLTSGLVMGIFLTSAFFALKYFHKYQELFFSLSWFLIGFIPTSGIIPINGIFFEHFLYFPSIGFFTLIVFLLVKILKQKNRFFSLFLCCLFVLIIILFCIRTINRNAQWRDPITFYTQTLQFTESSRVRNNLAMAYAEQGRLKEALKEYKNAISSSDTYPQTHYNLGNVYVQLGNFQEAEKEYKKTLELDPSFYLAHLNLFQLYKAGSNKQGIEDIITAIRQLAQKNNNFNKLLFELEEQR